MPELRETMGEGWQPGDLALCVSNSHRTLGDTKRVVPGRVYTVTGSYVSRRCGSLALVLAEAKPRKNPGFHAFLFRKIRPHTPDEEDAETIRLLNGEPLVVDAALSRARGESHV